ncbi:response regulator transcription factor [Cohnella thermotolerans]|uniref:response regulator transcription factor n=1 Tax=Cohnella thermotolerans TaxID=329858 RepID=UPI000410EF8A|nr:response regulator transcription factor [Cohnella thermotolerans]
MNKVMLVEDEMYARQGLRNLIEWERFGFEVGFEAENGEEALRLIEDAKPELVITDIRMPVLDGLELIRTVRESGNQDTKFIIISGYGDFKYAQKAIKFGVKDFILKPVDETELTDTLAHLAVQIERDKMLKDESPAYSQKALERLLLGKASEEEIGTIAKLLGLEREGTYYYAFAEMNGIQSFMDKDSAAEWMSELRSAMARTAEELGLVRNPVHIREQKPGVYGFLLNFGSSVRTNVIAEAADLFVRRLRQRFGLPIMVYAGEGVRDLGEIQRAYSTACAAMEYKYAFADRSVLSYGDVKGCELQYAEFEPGEYAKLLEQVEEGERDAMFATADWIFEQIQRKRYAPEAVQNAVARFAFGVIGSIRAMQGDENELRSLEPILQWRDHPITLDGLKERFRAFLEESSETIARLRKNNAMGDIAKIKSYIEKHYNEDLSLKSIAARFYMNPVYLGQLFKKTYGVYFNDFLLQIRIHNAKRLLRQTEKRVYEIARSVGFDNADYFVIKFEKVEGKTPTAYRNELMAK